MTDLLTFLRARLDDDERVAREGCDDGSPHWTRQHDPYSPGEIRDGDGYVVVHYEDSTPSVYQSEHIARHDPARVLREVEAKRRILDIHGYPYCAWCDDGGHAGEAGQPCVHLSLLALPYDSHPDYRPEWRPA